MTLHLDDLESRVLEVSPGDTVDLSHMIMAADFAEGDGPTEAPTEATEAPPEIISPEAFTEQWGQLHDLMGGMVSMRTEAPCPLGAQARNEAGQVAAAAAYSLLSGNPVTAHLFLSPNSSFLGQLAAIALHGFACVQVVKASRAQGEAATVNLARAA